VAGLSFRPIRGEQDADALSAAHAARAAHDHLDPFSSSGVLPSREDLGRSLAEAATEDRQEMGLDLFGAGARAAAPRRHCRASGAAQANPPHRRRHWQGAPARVRGRQVSGRL